MLASSHARSESLDAGSPLKAGSNEALLREEHTLLHAGARTLASGMGLASVVGAFVGPEGAVAGAVIGGVAGLMLSVLRRYAD